MEGLLGTALVIGAIVLIIVVTKAIWQWVLGTDILIQEAKKQTELLERIVLNQNGDTKINLLSKEEKAKLFDKQNKKE